MSEPKVAPEMSQSQTVAERIAWPDAQAWTAHCEQALQTPEATQMEIVLLGTRTDLTRFANSVIHQNLSQQDLLVNVRAVVGKRIGVASAHALEPQVIAETARRAVAIARVQEENPDFSSLPAPEPLPALPPQGDSISTPEQRAEAVARIVDIVRSEKLSAAGSVRDEADWIVVGNSLGVKAHFYRTTSTVQTVVSAPNSSGYAESIAVSLADHDLDGLARRAATKAVAGRDPRELPPGDYTVILEPPAVADLLGYLGWVGFSALAFLEGRSFMCDHRGQKVAADSITLWDDGLDARGLVAPFDFEGVPKRKVVLIERGVAQGLVYDSFTGGRAGEHSTGHAYLAPNPAGPFASNLFLSEGEADLEAMIASTQRGLLITRFHYTNIVHPRQAVLTGMTLDGTFLIEGGKVAGGVRNMRFTQGILEALAAVSMVGKQARLSFGGPAAVYAPPLKIDSFHFSAVTEF